MLSLPTECYCMIFNNFRNNYKELLACALVNRHWCGIVMPIMWSEPKRKFRDERLIKIFLLTLNIEEQTLLIPYKMNFPTQPKPLLEYTNFITSITRDLYDGISFLPNLFGKHEVTADFRDAILISLIKMFLRTGKSLKSLYLEDIDCNHINIKDTTITSVELVLPQTVSDGFKRKTLDGLIDNLKETSTLTTLSFVSVRIGIKRMKKLIKIFYNSIVLNSLGVYSFPLGNRSGKLLATFLIKNTTLTSLHLTGKKSINSIGLRLANSLGSVGGKAIEEGLCQNITLTQLNLLSNNIDFNIRPNRPNLEILV
ncbi:f-box domain-containing protein [Gigaspora margarita]|uniref:F-box domain-containing protein n=1 Tax=Gigaspora margarita TaxID=4874 RepID=A0A8H4ACZ0_GIGMA|nr:f-box domain-containing protein [Gigaspora margarita]